MIKKTVKAKVEPKLKKDVEYLFKNLGLTTTEAINLFFHQVQLRKGLPFNIV
ncbi:MAG: type II toxin-antitoxin system RelB/DinJ family antitoxin, partial [Candidatus Marinimicrobia bacterium]|nr:type II toxin-antitoxin system RelB/DinJ family antitoxin [Candidatus Neomarinimicrobiota bacterium]